MNDIEQIKRCMGLPIKKMIKDEFDKEMEFEFYPLGIDFLPDFLQLQKSLEGNPEGIMNRENSELMIKLVKEMLRKSFPEGVPDDVIDRFAMRNLPVLQEALGEVNVPKLDKGRTKLIQERIKKMKDAKQTQSNKEQTAEEQKS